jgi:membrane associated rhomboid family serine protease
MTSNDNKNNDDKSNVVDFKMPRKTSIEKEHKLAPPPPNEPIINLPLFTKYLLGSLIVIHLIVTFIINNEQLQWTVLHLGFIPARFTGHAEFEALSLLTPFTSMFLHGGWLHLGMNCVMLLAFGSGIERWMGGKKMIAFFIACGLVGIAFHFALNHQSINPVIGASAGISGLFAAALVMLNKNTIGMTGKYGLWPIAIFWVVISVVLGFVDTPQMGIQSGEIAWAAHVGGFLGGFAVLKLMRVI